MKKYISFGLGLLLLGGSVLPLTNASRDAYHAYLYQQAKEKRANNQPQYRPFSEGRITRSSHSKARKLSTGVRYAFRRPGDMVRGQGTVSASKSRMTTNRYASVGAKMNMKRKSYQPSRISSLHGQLSTYVNNEFSLQIPTTWSFDHEGMKTLLMNGDVLVTVQKVESGCQSESFMACTIAVAKDLNHNDIDKKSPADKILPSHTINRLGQKWDAFRDSRTQTQTVKESFTAFVGSEQFYFARYYVQAENGKDVFVVEAKMPLSEAAKKMEMLRSMFGSFRIF